MMDDETIFSRNEYAKVPTKIRVFFEDTGWSIDGVDDTGNFTEAVWDHYNGVRMTKEVAIAAAREFAADHDWDDLPVIVDD